MSNPVLDTIHSRCTIRGYTDQPLTNEQIADLANAALAAPSAVNKQPWQIIAVKDKNLLLEVEKATINYYIDIGDEAIIEKNKNRGNKVFYNAPVVFFIPIEEGGFGRVDCGIVAQNIALAAKSMGLGSAIVAMPRAAFMGKQTDELRAKLSFPEGYVFGIAVAVGHPAVEGKPHDLNLAKLTLIG